MHEASPLREREDLDALDRLEEVLRPLLGYLDDGPILSILDRAELRLRIGPSAQEKLPEVLLIE